MFERLELRPKDDVNNETTINIKIKVREQKEIYE